MEIASILAEVKKYKTSHVTVTGGEPLAQKNCIDLLQQLCDLGYDVSLETSGAILVDAVDERVVKILDVKTPASGEVTKNRFENFTLLSAEDQIKFVICDENDYHWSKQLIEDYQLGDICELLFSPGYELLDTTTLADCVFTTGLVVIIGKGRTY